MHPNPPLNLNNILTMAMKWVCFVNKNSNRKSAVTKSDNCSIFFLYIFCYKINKIIFL